MIVSERKQIPTATFQYLKESIPILVEAVRPTLY